MLIRIIRHLRIDVLQSTVKSKEPKNHLWVSPFIATPQRGSGANIRSGVPAVWGAHLCHSPTQGTGIVTNGILGSDPCVIALYKWFRVYSVTYAARTYLEVMQSHPFFPFTPHYLSVRW